VTGSRLILGAVASTLVLGALAVVQAQAASHAAHKSIAVGTKSDEPGLGRMQADGSPAGVGVATYIAGSLGYRPDQIRWVSALSSEREKLIRLPDSHDRSARPHPRRPHPRRPRPPIDGKSVPRGRKGVKND